MFKKLLNNDDVKNIKDYIDKSESYKGMIEDAEEQYKNNIMDVVEDKDGVIKSKNKLRNLFNFYEKSWHGIPFISPYFRFRVS